MITKIKNLQVLGIFLGSIILTYSTLIGITQQYISFNGVGNEMLFILFMLMISLTSLFKIVK